MFGEPVDWDGFFANREAYERWIADEVTILSVEQLEAIPREALLERWGREYLGVSQWR